MSICFVQRRELRRENAEIQKCRNRNVEGRNREIEIRNIK